MSDVEPLAPSRMEGHARSYINDIGTSRNVICCVLGYIYTQTEDEELRFQLRRAAAMAKRMNAKLEERKRNSGAE